MQGPFLLPRVVFVRHHSREKVAVTVMAYAYCEFRAAAVFRLHVSIVQHTQFLIVIVTFVRIVLKVFMFGQCCV